LDWLTALPWGEYRFVHGMSFLLLFARVVWII
jgi:hypothetical protein